MSRLSHAMRSLVTALLMGVLPMAELDRQERGVPDRVVAEQVRLYEAALDDVNAALARAIERLATEDSSAAANAVARQAQLRSEIARALSRLGASARQLSPELERAVRAGIAAGAGQLRDLGINPERPIPGATATSFTRLDGRAIELIAQDTTAKAQSAVQADLAGAAQAHAANAEALLRRLSTITTADGRRPIAEPEVNRSIARGIATGDPRIADRALRDLFREPGSGLAESYRRVGGKIIQVGKATLSVRAYTEIVVTTRTREATVEARHRRLNASGVQLVQVTGRNSKNFCTNFLGMVFALGASAVEIDGVTYPPLAGLPRQGPPFHPRCSKSTAAYIPQLVSEGRVRAFERAAIEFRARERTGRLLSPAA